MKLSTMILPTGEFVILAGEADENENGLFDALAALRDGTGAASVLFTTQPLDGQDSLVWHGPALRRDPDLVENLLDAGVNFTPAGLVDHRSLSEIVEKDVLGQDARTPQRDLVAGVERAPEFPPAEPESVHHCGYPNCVEPGDDCDPEDATPRYADGTLVSQESPDAEDLQPYKPQIGDRVKVTGFSFMGSDRRDQVGEVTSIDGPYWPSAPIVVRFDKSSGFSMTANYKPTDLKLAPAEPYVPQAGDQVRITGASITGLTVPIDQTGIVGYRSTLPDSENAWTVQVGEVQYHIEPENLELISRG